MSNTISVYDTREYLKSQISTSIKVLKSLKNSSRSIFMAGGWKKSISLCETTLWTGMSTDAGVTLGLGS